MKWLACCLPIKNAEKSYKDQEQELQQCFGDIATDIVDVKEWLAKPDTLHSSTCVAFDQLGYGFPSYILITDSELILLRQIPNRSNLAYIQSRRPLVNIVKITSKKRLKKYITFYYGTVEEGLVETKEKERLMIPKSEDFVPKVKGHIVKILDGRALDR